jgi:hypothetical protein
VSNVEPTVENGSKNYSTRLKKELLDNPPTGPHLQRAPQIGERLICFVQK